VQYLGELGAEVKVLRNDEIDVAGIGALNPSHLILSPGPCTPTEAGVCVPAIQAFKGKLPMLGVCLGHQSIGQALGGKIVRAQRQMHGKASTITNDGCGVFKGLPQQFSVIRYHSLVIEPATCPPELEVSARSEDGEIMAVRHRELAGTKTPIEGVQYHPESILSEHGHAQLKNFLELVL